MLWDMGAALQHADTVPGVDGACWDLAALYSQTAVKKKGVLSPPHTEGMRAVSQQASRNLHSSHVLSEL